MQYIDYITTKLLKIWEEIGLELSTYIYLCDFFKERETTSPK